MLYAWPPELLAEALLLFSSRAPDPDISGLLARAYASSNDLSEQIRFLADYVKRQS